MIQMGMRSKIKIGHPWLEMAFYDILNQTSNFRTIIGYAAQAVLYASFPTHLLSYPCRTHYYIGISLNACNMLQRTQKTERQPTC